MDSQVIWILAATNRTDYQNIADLFFYVRWHLIKTEQKTRIRNQVYVTFLSVLKIARMQDTRCCWMKKNPTKLLIRLVGQRYNEDNNIDE
jgi:hypothetical protein